MISSARLRLIPLLLLVASAIASAQTTRPATQPAAGNLPEPTRVSLDLASVPASEAFSRLLETSTFPIELQPADPAQGEWNEPRISLQVRNEPFLVVLHELARRADVTPRFTITADGTLGLTLVHPAIRGDRLSASDANHAAPVVWVGTPACAGGPFLVLARCVRETGSSYYRVRDGAASFNRWVSLTVLAEPQRRVLVHRQFILTEAIDDRGRSLLTDQAPYPGWLQEQQLQPLPREWGVDVALAEPSPDARKIATLAGRVQALLVVREHGFDVPLDVSKIPGEPVEHDGMILQVRQFQRDGDHDTLLLSIRPASPNAPAFPRRRQDAPPGRLSRWRMVRQPKRDLERAFPQRGPTDRTLFARGEPPGDHVHHRDRRPRNRDSRSLHEPDPAAVKDNPECRNASARQMRISRSRQIARMGLEAQATRFLPAPPAAGVSRGVPGGLDRRRFGRIMIPRPAPHRGTLHDPTVLVAYDDSAGAMLRAGVSNQARRSIG